MGISQSKRKREKFANYSFEHNQSLQTRSATTSSRKFHHSTTATHSSDKIRGARPSSSPPQRQNSDTRVGAGKGELYAGVESNSQFLPQNTDYEAFDFNLHFALRKLFDGNVISTVLPKLKPNAVVVDIGCRNGAWIMDMATQFPTCKYIGVRAIGDEAPLDADALKLPNAKFEDIIDNSRLPTLQDNSVDVVHMRVQFLVLTRSQWKMILKEAYRILKPGGVMQASELLYAVGGTVMVESFLETVRNVLNSVDRDLEVALKLPTLLSDAGFQIMQSMRRDVHYTSDGHLAQEFVKINLQAFQRRQELLAPRMGLDPEEYAQRAEMVCAQCVQADAHLEWYVHVGKKPSSSTLATSANPP